MADFGCATNVLASFCRHDENGDAANPPIKKWRKSVAIFWVPTRTSPSGGHSHPCGGKEDVLEACVFDVEPAPGFGVDPTTN